LEYIKSTNYNLALGSLGGGNHFIEVNDDPMCGNRLVIHTGSRNLGKQVAEYYQDVAVENCKKECNFIKDTLIREKKLGAERHNLESLIKGIQEDYIKVPRELNHLEGKDKDDYIHDMMIVQEYAKINRETIFDTINKDFLYLGNDYTAFHTVHNYISPEDGILRKGAVSATAGRGLIIPINMRDGSLLCIGKGNPDWNNSAPHGAGRLMGRKEAKRKLQMDDFKKSMDGIYTTSVTADTLDESPMAYKPMQEIINNVQDTVTVVSVIKPIYNFKAGGD
jgi:RNA-splicing ligase RtcB